MATVTQFWSKGSNFLEEILDIIDPKHTKIATWSEILLFFWNTLTITFTLFHLLSFHFYFQFISSSLSTLSFFFKKYQKYHQHFFVSLPGIGRTISRHIHFHFDFIFFYFEFLSFSFFANKFPFLFPTFTFFPEKYQKYHQHLCVSMPSIGRTMSRHSHN